MTEEVSSQTDQAEQEAVLADETQPASEKISLLDRTAIEDESAISEEQAQKTEKIIPDKYEFTFEEGLSVDEGLLGHFSELAKEIGLSQDEAQKIANLAPVIDKSIKENQIKSILQMQENWAASAKSNPVLGGHDFDRNMSIVKKTFDTVMNMPNASPEFKEKFMAYVTPFDPVASPNGGGQGENPVFLEAFYHLGRMMSEATVRVGSPVRSRHQELKEVFPL